MIEIIIRAATPLDVEELHKLHTHPQVYAQTLQLPYATTEIWENDWFTPRRPLSSRRRV